MRVIVSGNRPVETMSKQTSRLAFLDGRMNDWKRSRMLILVPLVSDQWSSHFKWRGRGEMPADEVTKLKDCAKTHAQKRKLRFWGAPDNVEHGSNLRA